MSPLARRDGIGIEDSHLQQRRSRASQGLLQGGRRARLWEIYTEKYAEIAEAARVRFMGDVDRAFAAAYDRKVGELRARRRSELLP